MRVDNAELEKLLLFGEAYDIGDDAFMPHVRFHELRTAIEIRN